MKTIDSSRADGQAVPHHDLKRATRETGRRLWVGALPTADMPATRIGERPPRRPARREALGLAGIELAEPDVGYDPYDRGSNLR